MIMLNYNSLVEKMTELCQCYEKPYTSLAGRIASVKMLLLSHIIYMFRTLLAYLPWTYLRKLQGLINHYILRAKKPRFFRGILTCPRNAAGLGTTNRIF